RTVFGHRLAVEIRELAQGVSVGNPFAQFPVVPTFDPHDDERAQNLLWRQSAATSPGVFQTALQIASYGFDQFLVVVKTIGDVLQQRLPQDAPLAPLPS